MSVDPRVQQGDDITAFDRPLVTVDWTPFPRGPGVQLSHSNTRDI